jgi:hypothetical protein
MSRTITLFFLSILSCLFIANASYANDSLIISDSRIPEAPPGAQVMAGFMKIHNPSTQAIAITAVSSPMFENIEMHLSKEVNGIAKMLPQKSLNIPANVTLILQAGSYHLMLIKPKQPLRNGDSVFIEFSLSDKTSLPLHTTVIKGNSHKAREMKCAAGKCGGN